MARTSAAGAGRESTESNAPLEPARIPSSFVELLSGCTAAAVHLEMRDAYTPRDPDYLRWRDGDHFDPAERWPDWIRLIASVTAKGVVIRRARIVSEPVTDYIRYEYGVTAGLNIAAGELVRWLPRRWASDLALPGNDFWLFDNRLVLFNHFAGDGSSADKELRAEPAVIRLCASAFEAVWDRATPHEKYRPA